MMTILRMASLRRGYLGQEEKRGLGAWQLLVGRLQDPCIWECTLYLWRKGGRI